MNKKESRTFKIKYANGYYLFKLEPLLEKINSSKYALSQLTQMDYKIINRYAHGDLTRFDAKVIAKICDTCNCKLEDIIEYVPNSK